MTIELVRITPRSASGYWVEGVDKHGDVHSQNAWGDVDKFWRE